MTSVLRRAARLVRNVGVLHVAASGACVLAAWAGSDHQFDEVLASGKHVVPPNKGGWLRDWRRHADKELTPGEEVCVDAVASLMAFDLRPEVLSVFSPDVVLNDAVFRLETSGELKDAWSFLSLFYSQSTPYLVEIVRPRSRSSTAAAGELIVKFETEGTLKGLGITYTFPSIMRIRHREADQLVSTSTHHGHPPFYSKDGAGAGAGGNPHRHLITSVEHRWFGGPVPSKRTLAPIIGDGAVWVRRLNGFLMSVVLTQTDVLHRTTE